MADLTMTKAPESLMDYLELMLPFLKTYLFLFVMYKLAQRFNASLDAEAALQDKERQRPKLSKDLMVHSDSEEEDESEEEEEQIEELITEGSKLVKMEDSETEKRKNKTASKALFDGLKKIEKELKEKKEGEESNVSWNELHQGMLKRYQEKFPNHGLQTNKGDDYDDEFKELLRKNNIDMDELKAKAKTE